MSGKRKPANRRYQGKPGDRRDAGGRFVPGTSGNPNGRPKEFPDFVKMCREQGSPIAFTTLLSRCASNDDRAAVQAALGVLAYAWGKPKQAVELTGRDGGPIEAMGPAWAPKLTLEQAKRLRELAETGERGDAGGSGGST